MRRHIHQLAGCLAVTMLAMMTGCGGSGSLSMTGSNQMDISGDFQTAVFAVEGLQSVNVMLISGPVDQPQAILHLQMYYMPEAGRTPVDEHATNVVARYVMFTDQGVAVYGGAGLLSPGFRMSSSRLIASLRNVNMRLLDASEGFQDQLVLPWANGSVNAVRDDAQTLTLMQQMNRMVTEKLGYPRFVMAE